MHDYFQMYGIYFHAKKYNIWHFMPNNLNINFFQVPSRSEHALYAVSSHCRYSVVLGINHDPSMAMIN